MHGASNTRAFLLWLMAVLFVTAHAGAAPLLDPQKTFNKSDLEELVAPIALYPDQLHEAMLRASTFPDQIVDAGLLIKTEKDAKRMAGTFRSTRRR